MKKTLTLLLVYLAALPAQSFAAVGTTGPTLFMAPVVFSADRLSTASTAYNKPFDFRTYRQASFQFVWASLTGGLDGVCKVQVSLDKTNWVDKTGATFNVTSANGSDVINITSLPEGYYRTSCTHGTISGGTIAGYFMAKE